MFIGQAIREQFHTRGSESGFRSWIDRGNRSVTGTDPNRRTAVYCRFFCCRPAHQRRRSRLWSPSDHWRFSARTEWASRRRVRPGLLFWGFVDAAAQRSTEHDSWRSSRNAQHHQWRTWGQSGGHDPNSPDAPSLIAGRSTFPVLILIALILIVIYAGVRIQRDNEIIHHRS